MEQQKPRNNEDEVNDERIAELDIDKLRREHIPRAHGWKQQGPMLICGTCPMRHSTYIGMHIKLTGIQPDGTPILEKS